MFSMDKIGVDCWGEIGGEGCDGRGKREDVRVEAVVSDHGETFFGECALGFEDVIEVLYAISMSVSIMESLNKGGNQLTSSCPQESITLSKPQCG